MTEDGIQIYDGGFDYYLEKTRLSSAQAAEKQETTQKKSGGQGYYRSKQQRALEAKRRSRIVQLEKLMEACDRETQQLEQEIADPQLAADYTLLAEKCARLEEIKGEADHYMEEWLGLQED